MVHARALGRIVDSPRKSQSHQTTSFKGFSHSKKATKAKAEVNTLLRKFRKAAIRKRRDEDIKKSREQSDTDGSNNLPEIPATQPPHCRRKSKSRRRNRIYKWIEILPSLVEAYLSRSNRTGCGDAPQHFSHSQACRPVRSNVLRISLTTYDYQSYSSCSCLFTSDIVRDGFFPASPSCPETAFSLDLLALFHSIFMFGPISKIAFAAGLRAHLQLLYFVKLPDFLKPFYNAYKYWLEVQTRARETVEIMIERETKENFASTAIQQLCPACSARYDTEDCAKPFIFSVDGNFQHRRYRNKRGSSEVFSAAFSAPMFKDVPSDLTKATIEDRSMVNTNSEDTCSHNFTAVDRPFSMRHYDETGILGTVCRHGIPLRYMNLKGGEKYSWTLELVREIADIAFSDIKGEVKIFSKMHLQYDIGCRFEAYIKKHDPALAVRMSVGLDAFHVHAHEPKCRIRYSPRYTEGIGESDGDGGERDWERKDHLIASGRNSNPGERNQQLSAQSQHYAIRTRISSPRIMEVRYVRAQEHVQELTNGLRELRDKADVLASNEKIKQVDLRWIFDDASLVHLTSELKNYFRSSGALKAEDWKCLTVHKMLLAEEQLEGMILPERQLQPMSKTTTTNNHISALLERQKKETDEALKELHQSREEWRHDGILRTRYAELRISEDELYQLSVEAFDALDAIASEKLTPALKKAAQERYDVVSKKAMAMLSNLNIPTSEWHPGNPRSRFRAAEMRHQVRELEGIYKEILGQVYALSVESKVIHKKLSGQKEAGTLRNAISKRRPKIQQLIKKFNTASQKLPDDKAVILPEDFLTSTQSGINKDEMVPSARDMVVQMKFQHLRYASFGWKYTETQPLNWSLSPMLVEAVDCYAAKQRASEELDLLLTETSRLTQWLDHRSNAILRFYLSKKPIEYGDILHRLCWDDLQLLSNLRGATNLFKNCTLEDRARLNASENRLLTILRKVQEYEPKPMVNPFLSYDQDSDVEDGIGEERDEEGEEEVILEGENRGGEKDDDSEDLESDEEYRDDILLQFLLDNDDGEGTIGSTDDCI